jgi:hypothetical protein
MTIHVRRREFIVTLTGVATWPLASRKLKAPFEAQTQRASEETR